MSADVRSRRGATGDPEAATSGEGEQLTVGSSKASRQWRLPVTFAMLLLLILFAMFSLVSLGRRPSTPDDTQNRFNLRAERSRDTSVSDVASVPDPLATDASASDAAAVAEPLATDASASDAAAGPEPIPPEALAPSPEWRRHGLQQDEGLPAGPESTEVKEPVGPLNATIVVRCATTTGPITIQVQTHWAPIGAVRFLQMVTSGFFSTKVAMFRAVQGMLCQTGVAGDPAIHQAWEAGGPIDDDPQWLDLAEPNRMRRGYLSFAGGGNNSRGTEFFFAFRDIELGDSPWEVPFGKLIGQESFDAMDHWYAGYGDLPEFGGTAPDQAKMYEQGTPYLEESFPDIDYITACAIAG